MLFKNLLTSTYVDQNVNISKHHMFSVSFTIDSSTCSLCIYTPTQAIFIYTKICSDQYDYIHQHMLINV